MVAAASTVMAAPARTKVRVERATPSWRNLEIASRNGGGVTAKMSKGASMSTAEGELRGRGERGLGQPEERT